MKTAPMPRSAVSESSFRPDAGSNGGTPLSMVSASLMRVRRYLATALPAMGLADGGDVEGAADLVARSGAGKS
jgi:hypothetical protein